MLLAEGCQGGKLRVGEDGARGVCWGGEEEGSEGGFCMNCSELGNGRIVVGGNGDRDWNRDDTEGGEDVVVAWVAWGENGDAVAGVKKGSEERSEGGGRTGRDEDAFCADGEVVGGLVVVREGLAEGGETRAWGVALRGVES